MLHILYFYKSKNKIKYNIIPIIYINKISYNIIDIRLPIKRKGHSMYRVKKGWDKNATSITTFKQESENIAIKLCAFALFLAKCLPTPFSLLALN